MFIGDSVYRDSTFGHSNPSEGSGAGTTEDTWEGEGAGRRESVRSCSSVPSGSIGDDREETDLEMSLDRGEGSRESLKSYSFNSVCLKVGRQGWY